MAFELGSPAFEEGADIPAPFTCEGEGLSPSLTWDGEPEGTRGFALIMHDPDAPRGDFTHWLLWDIDAGRRSLPEGPGADAAGIPGKNDFGQMGYGAPCPPRGHGVHRYVFELCAVDVEELSVREGAGRAEVDTALRGHVLATATLRGCYAHPA